MRRGGAVLGFLALVALLWLGWSDGAGRRRADPDREGAPVSPAPPSPVAEPDTPVPASEGSPAAVPPPPAATSTPEREVTRVEMKSHDWVFRILDLELMPDRGAPEDAPPLDSGWVVIDTRSRIVNLWFPERSFDADSARVESSLRQWTGPGAERPAEVATGKATGLTVAHVVAQVTGRWKHLASPLFGPAGAGWNREAAVTLRFRVGGAPYTLRAAVRYPAEGRPVLIVSDGG